MSSKEKLVSDQEIEIFDKASANYEEALDKNLWLAGGNGEYFYQAKIKLLKERLSSNPQRILDFGCGTGHLAKLLSIAFPESKVVGYDPSAKSIEEACRDNASANLTFSNSISDLGESFDLVIAAGVFHHIPPALRLENLRVLTGLMNKTASIFMFEHNPWSLPTQVIVKLAPEDRNAKLLSTRETLNLFGSAGLKTDIAYISFFPPYLKPLLKFEKFLTGVPLGAQFVAQGKFN